jgi:hypothetical protein
VTPDHRISHLYQNSCAFRFDRNKDVIDLGAAIHSIEPRQEVEFELSAIPNGSPWNWKT